jgi:hypothetical protein
LAFIDKPPIIRRLPTRSSCINEQHGETPHPPVDRDMIDLDAPIDQHLFDVAVGQPDTRLPAHNHGDHLRREPEAQRSLLLRW